MGGRVALLTAATALLTGGCAENILAPKVDMIPQAQPYQYTDQDWAVVLRDFVRDGRVDYDALSKNRDALDRYYALLSVTGPTRTPDQFPTWAQTTAYWINAYNSLVLVAVLSRYPVTTMYDLGTPRLEYDYRFKVDGAIRTLASIESELFEQSRGDVRAVMATSRAAVGTPALVREPIRAATLERQLAALAASALDNPALLRVDHENRAILIWQGIFRRQADLVRFWQKQRRVPTAYPFNVLLELASPDRARALQTAVGYTLREIPFDRALNRTAPRAGG